MRINKTYLKLGVAFTATFGFGFLVGTIYQQWKTKKALKQSADEFKQFVKEGIGVSETVPEQEPIPEETIKETEDEDVAKRSKIEEYNEECRQKGVRRTKERMARFVANHENGSAYAGIVETIFKSYIDDELFIEDTTPWGCSMERPVVCMVFDKKEGQMYWGNDSFCGEPLNRADIDFIILAFYCFATYRQDGDGTKYFYEWSPYEAVCSVPQPFMRHDDHVYVDDLRIIWLPTINREVWIRTVEEPNRELIQKLLMEAIGEFTQIECEEDWD